MINGWNGALVKESVNKSNIFPYHKLKRDGLLYNVGFSSRAGLLRFTYKGWHFIKITNHDKCIIPIDFNFHKDSFDFYSVAGIDFSHADVGYVRKDIPSARLLCESEISMMHSYFPNTRGKSIFTDFNCKDGQRRISTYIVDTDKEDL